MQTAMQRAKTTKKKSDGPDAVDIHAGTRLRLCRNLAGLSQEQLGKASGLTFQQIQKYERGANRMSASRLYQFGRILNVSAAWFFDELQLSKAAPAVDFSDDQRTSWERSLPSAKEEMSPDSEMLLHRETLALMRAYYRVTDPQKRRKVYDVIKSMADTD